MIKGILEQDLATSVKYKWKKSEMLKLLGDDKLKVENWDQAPEEGHFFLRDDTHTDGGTQTTHQMANGNRNGTAVTCTDGLPAPQEGQRWGLGQTWGSE